MTYGELKAIKTTGFITNNVIDDVVNNGRFSYTKKAFESAEVSDYELNKIIGAAEREGVELLLVSPIVWNEATSRQRVGGTFGS